MKNKERRSFSILFSLLSNISIIVVAISVIFTLILIQYRTKDLIEQTDSRLFEAAELIREVLGADYHDLIVDEASLSNEQFNQIVARNDDICRRLKIQYLWSVLLVNGNIVFTSATHSDLNNPDSPCASFFEVHHDPEAFASAIQNDSKPSFSSFKNEWGEGRQVLVARKDSLGRTYIFGASVQLRELNAIVRKTISDSIGIGLGILFLSFLFAFVMARSFANPIARLTGAASRMATGDLDVSLAKAGTLELQSLTDSIDQMRRGLKIHMAELIESEVKHRILLENSSDPIFSFTSEGKYIYVNRAFAEGVGIPVEDIIGKSIWDVFPKEEADKRFASLSHVFKTGEENIIDVCVLRPDGDHYYLTTITPIKDIAGKVTSAICSSKDITESKRTEDVLKVIAESGIEQGEDIFRFLVRQLAVSQGKKYALISLIEPQDNSTAHTLAVWSDGSYSVNFSYSLEGTPCRNVAMQGTCFYESDIQTLFPENKLLVEMNAESYWGKPLIDNSGNVLGIIAILDDKPMKEKQHTLALLNSFATRATVELGRKKAEDALQESEANLREAQEIAGLGRWELDLTSNKLKWSEGIFTLFEVNPETFSATYESFIEFIHPEDRSLVDKAYRESVEKKLPYEIEHRILLKDGRIKWVVETGRTEYDDNGSPIFSVGTVQNVTELRKAEQNYRMLFHEMLDGFALHEIICDENGNPSDYRFLDINPAFEKMIGIKAEELKGKTVLEKMPATEKYWIDTYGKVALTGEPAFFENYHAGLKKYFKVTAFSPALNQFACIFSDISERKRFVEELQEKEVRFRSFFEESPIGIEIYDVEGRMIQANSACLELFGVTDFAQVKGFSLFDDPNLENENKNKLRRGEQVKYQIPFDFEKVKQYKLYETTKSGIVYIDVQITPLGLSTKESLSGYLVQIIDTTERKLAEINLKAANANLEALWSVSSLTNADIRKISDHVLATITKMTGSEYGFYGLLNDDESVMTIHSWSGEAMKDCPIMDKAIHFSLDEAGIWSEAIRHRMPLILNDYYATGHPAKKGLPEGHISLDKLLIVPFIEDNKVVSVAAVANRSLDYAQNDIKQISSFLSSIQSIVDKKRAEEEKAKLESQLIQAQKMEAVGRLAGGVAHDFNNLLTIVMANSEMALMSLEADHPSVEEIKEIKNASVRAADLTRQLLAFARKQTVIPKVLDLNETIESMLRIIRRLIGENINLDWKPGQNLWLVKIDPSQIDQILANLSVNARDAITNVGNLSIETENIVFDETYCSTHAGHVPGDYVMLAVSDNGCGMDVKTSEQLFEPFFTTKEIGKGTGLGLATVYGIIKQNNGFINVYSELGHGTTFKIYLPRIKIEKADLNRSVIEKPDQGTETILLAEDETHILKLGVTILERYGYKVLAASTPKELLRMVEQHENPVHLLVTDVVMPGMNGRDLRDKLAVRWPEIKTIFMSGYTANVIAHHGVIDEGIHFLQKPFSVHSLASKVREVLDQK